MSRTEEISNEKGEVDLREFYCGECNFYSLTSMNKDFIVCSDCFKTLYPNQDFLLKIIKRLE